MVFENRGYKIAEVPVYALSREDFNRKVEARKRSDFEKYGSGASELSFDIEYGKSRYYDYNHIIGYIVVSKKKDDILFELYKTDIQRYHWDSRKKHFFYNDMITGYHFRIENNTSNEDARNRVNSIMDEIIKEIFPPKSYADRQMLSLILENIDIVAL